MVFDRRQIAEILGVPPVVVRNWSTGNPFRIEPSIRALGKRGSANLYALEEVYLFGVAAYLLKAGLQPLLIKGILRGLQLQPERLQAQNREDNVLQFEPHFLLQRPRWEYQYLSVFLHLGGILEEIDLRIVQWGRKQKPPITTASLDQTSRVRKAQLVVEMPVATRELLDRIPHFWQEEKQESGGKKARWSKPAKGVR